MTRKGEFRLRFGMFVLALCVVADSALMATTCLDSAGVFVEGYIGMLGLFAVKLAVLAGFVAALVLSARAVSRRQPDPPAYAALSTGLVTLALLYGGLSRRVERWNFESRLIRRVEVVDLARHSKLAGKLAGPCDCFYADLPDGYSSLSARGEVLVSHHPNGFSVTFFIARHGLFNDDDYSAFVFRSDHASPQTGEEDTDRFTEVRALRPHWFFVRHT